MGSTLVRNWFATIALERDEAIQDCATYIGETDLLPDIVNDYESSDWHLKKSDTDSRQHYLTINETVWGDNNDTAVFHRSNYLALLQDYPNTFIRMADNHTDWLILPFDAVVPDTLLKAIEYLYDYPIYDEEHYSRLQMELLNEEFEARQYDDLVYELNGILCGDKTQDVLHNEFRCTDEWVKAEFYTFLSTWDGDAWEEEDANTIYYKWQFMDAANEHIAQVIEWDWNARVTWLDTREEGLF